MAKVEIVKPSVPAADCRYGLIRYHAHLGKAVLLSWFESEIEKCRVVTLKNPSSYWTYPTMEAAVRDLEIELLPEGTEIKITV